MVMNHKPRQFQGRTGGRKQQRFTRKANYGDPMELDATTRIDQKKKKGGCYQCGKEGHFKRECPEGRKDSGWKNKSWRKDTPKKELNLAIKKDLDESTEQQGPEMPKDDSGQLRHAMLSWTACYDDSCLTHYSDKSATGWWPKETRKTKSLCLTKREDPEEDVESTTIPTNEQQMEHDPLDDGCGCQNCQAIYGSHPLTQDSEAIQRKSISMMRIQHDDNDSHCGCAGCFELGYERSSWLNLNYQQWLRSEGTTNPGSIDDTNSEDDIGITLDTENLEEKWDLLRGQLMEQLQELMREVVDLTDRINKNQDVGYTCNDILRITGDLQSTITKNTCDEITAEEEQRLSDKMSDSIDTHCNSALADIGEVVANQIREILNEGKRLPRAFQETLTTLEAYNSMKSSCEEDTADASGREDPTGEDTDAAEEWENGIPKGKGLRQLYERKKTFRPPIEGPHGFLIRCQFTGPGCEERRFTKNEDVRKHHSLHLPQLECPYEGCLDPEVWKYTVKQHLKDHHPEQHKGMDITTRDCYECGTRFHQQKVYEEHQLACEGKVWRKDHSKN